MPLVHTKHYTKRKLITLRKLIWCSKELKKNDCFFVFNTNGALYGFSLGISSPSYICIYIHCLWNYGNMNTWNHCYVFVHNYNCKLSHALFAIRLTSLCVTLFVYDFSLLVCDSLPLLVAQQKTMCVTFMHSIIACILLFPVQLQRKNPSP